MTEADRVAPGLAAETGAEVRLRRLRLRAWRRGTREMDLLLGPFADAQLGTMTENELDLFEALLTESDPDLYAWAIGREAPPQRHAGLLAGIAAHAAGRAAQESGVP